MRQSDALQYRIIACHLAPPRGILLVVLSHVKRRKKTLRQLCYLWLRHFLVNEYSTAVLKHAAGDAADLPALRLPSNLRYLPAEGRAGSVRLLKKPNQFERSKNRAGF